MSKPTISTSTEPRSASGARAAESSMSEMKRSKMKRNAVLVSGWRKLQSMDPLIRVLDHIRGPSVLIHGAARGVDQLAAKLARANTRGWDVLSMPAQWDEHGDEAGSRRNGAMLAVLTQLCTVGYVPHVLAFPGPDSRGTWDFINKARRCGFAVGIYRLGEDGTLLPQRASDRVPVQLSFSTPRGR